MREGRARPAASLLRFALLTAGLGAVFTALGPLLGDLSPLTRAAVPAAALMVVCPTVAAVVVGRWDGGLGAWLAALRQVRAPAWAWVLGVALMPAVVVMSTRGAAVGDGPGPVAAAGVAAVFLTGAVLEEAGYSAFVLPRATPLAGPLAVGAGIGVFWALWHVVPWVQGGGTVSWVAGQCVFTVAFRVLLVRLALASGALMWPATLAHASYNTAWALCPGAGAGLDPWWAAGLTAVAWLVLAGVLRAVRRRG